MTPKEWMIQRLKALCARRGLDVDIVADKAGVSADNLRLIIEDRKLPSGQPRGVGPTLQRRLEAAYPGWADPAAAPRPPLPTKGFKDPDDTDWQVLTDLHDLHPGDRTSWINGLHEEAEKAREIGRRYVDTLKRK